MPKQLLSDTKRIFDLKFLVAGLSGTGKTHLCATYTAGPVHFYMIDPGGEKTLAKLNNNRAPGCEITIDKFSIRDNKYSDFWNQLIKDEKEGFFKEMSERSGLVVLPDSLTSAATMAQNEVAKKNKRSLTEPGIDGKKGMRIQDWGQLGQWMKELVAVMNDLPCAAAMPAHLFVETNDDGVITGRYPMMPGQFRTSMGLYFDEVYLLENLGSTRAIHFVEKGKFQAKSRIFTPKSVKNITLQEIADAYISGDTLDDYDKRKK